VIQEAVHVTENEVREQYRVEQERVNFYFIRLSAGDFLSQTEIRPEEIQNYYERNKEALREPLKAQVEYLLYPFEHFSSKVQVSQKEIEDFYKLNLEKRFRQPKAVRVRHMFFRPSAAKDPQEKAQHRLKAEGVLQELRAGKDFAELAKKYSEDPSAAQGGDIGWVAQGQILPPLERVAFAMRKGEVSGLVETPLGYHILKVEEIREEKSKGLKEATEEIIRSIRAERGKSEAGKAVDADRERGLSGTDLSLLAKERGISYKLTSPFGLTEVVPEVGPVEEFNKAAFSLAPGEISPAIEGPSAYYLLRVRQRKEPTIPPLESVRSQIEKGLREMRALELASQKADAVLAQMKKEKEIQKVAKGHGLKVEETGWFLRHDPEIPKVGVLQEVKPGGIAISLYQPIADRIYTQKSSVYLFTFKESQGADMERFEREKGELLERALTEKRQRILKGFVEHLRAKARIEVQPKFLEEG
jgi:peptidyl-prolyl cis-trans isomerase D